MMKRIGFCKVVTPQATFQNSADKVLASRMAEDNRIALCKIYNAEKRPSVGNKDLYVHK